jgi:hypothetical protein
MFRVGRGKNRAEEGKKSRRAGKNFCRLRKNIRGTGRDALSGYRSEWAVLKAFEGEGQPSSTRRQDVGFYSSALLRIEGLVHGAKTPAGKAARCTVL